MQEVKVVVVDPVGLHARPATVAVNAASKCKCKVTVSFKERTVDMKSIMGVMSLGIPTQSEITITCNGEDEENALNTIVETLRQQKVIE
ncbi:MAG: HPr family phosphocarrier protein [Erysipelotrichaceae bacterium]|nr:HPr family phosphocarrier protein [Erysipelotrichaceae bacterium]